ncbi:MAG TPA: regulatory protein RecX [Candidatus Acidoferrum sp.]|nr:regulatory protein RecX [Candidatus Acidoferrum sp.]
MLGLLARPNGFFSLPLYFLTSLLHLLLVFSKPRQLDSQSSLYDSALRALTRRAYSVHEMKQLLSRRSDNSELIHLVIELLKREGHLDDARFAKQFARQRTQTRRQGKFRIARDLRARGVPDRHIEAALAEAASETDESALVRQRIERKLRSFRGEIDERKLASIYRSLLRAGFPADVVHRQLKSITRDEISGAAPAAEE